MRPKYRCIDCEQEFDEPEEVQESRGEFWGMPAYETMYYCPYCGGDIMENEDEDEEDDVDEEAEYERWERER